METVAFVDNNNGVISVSTMRFLDDAPKQFMETAPCN